MRPPKKDGQPTTVFFHVTVMGLDSIDETSMVSLIEIFSYWKRVFIFIIFNLLCRLMQQIYFLHKPGKIIDWDCRRIWHQNIGLYRFLSRSLSNDIILFTKENFISFIDCWKLSGWSKCGGQIPFSRMPSQVFLCS